MPIDFSSEAASRQQIGDEFTVKTHMMWSDGWFHDYDSTAQEWSSQQDTMHLAPVFCGAADWDHIEQLCSYFTRPPMHSGWAPLSWPPVVMTLVGAADTAQMPTDAAELAYRFIDASYRSVDSRERDEQDGLPGVTREYLRTIPTQDDESFDYMNAGIEGYGWGALSIHLLLRHIIGLRAEQPGTLTFTPFLPQTLRRVGARYRVEPVQWGKHSLSIEYTVLDPDHYRLHVSSTRRQMTADGLPEDTSPVEQEWTGEGAWGDEQIFQLP